MSNLGFRLAMREAGITVIETPVGDRYLIAAMLDGKYALGGEQSGHVIMLDHATTGDGMLTALHLLAQMAAAGRAAGRPGRGDDPLSAGPDQHPRRRQGPRGRRAVRWPRPWPPPRPSWAIPAGC